MSFEDINHTYALYLSPSNRGTQDTIREPLYNILRSAKKVSLCSQQLADEKLVNELALIRSKRNGKAHVLIESDYLLERKPASSHLIWEAMGDREKNRQCFLALLRAGVEVRTDIIKGALQHVNMVLSENENSKDILFITSANLSPGSINCHLNWGIVIYNEDLYRAASALYKANWDGDFREYSLTETVKTGVESVECAAGADGQAISLALKAIEIAKETIFFAYFNVSKDSRVEQALLNASKKGVKVHGVVDGDQEGLSWDAVPHLHEGGVDVRYYPGALTGAIGRMHYKMFTVDTNIMHLSTANASHAAEDSFEFGLTIHSHSNNNGVNYVQGEINRLLLNAKKLKDL